MATEQRDTIHSVQTVFSIESYDPQKKFDRWLMRLESAFNVFTVPINKKAAYLLHYMGPEAYDVLCDKISPELPSTKSYDDLVKIMKLHYNPEPLEIAENFRFLQRKQREGESCQDYLTALQRLATTCNFGDYLKKALRNQFVFGLSSQNIQSRLLEQKKLTIERAIEIAASMEISARDAAQLHSFSSNQVHSVQAQGSRNVSKFNQKPSKWENSSSNSNFKCFRCGSSKHLANVCKAKNLNCSKCNRKGHVAQVCMKNSNSTGKQQVHDIEEILAIHSKEHVGFRSKFTVSLLVNNMQFRFEVDSGAAVSIISFNTYSKHFLTLTLKNTHIKLCSYSEQALEVAGYIEV